MKLFYFCCLLFSLLVSSCNHKKMIPNYSNGVCCEDSVISYSHVMNDTSLWKYPLQIDYTDSAIIILDEIGSHFLHLFSSEGYLLKSFATKGQGPGELLSGEKFHLSQTKDTLYIYDSLSRKIVAYNMKAIMSDTLSFDEYFVDYGKLPKSKTPTIIYDMLPINDSLFLVKANHQDIRYGLYSVNNHDINPIYTTFLTDFFSIDEEDIWSIFSSNTCTTLSPNKLKFANATYIGGILELFSFQYNKTLTPFNSVFIYEPKYGVAEGAIPTFVVCNQDTQIGFEDVYATDNFLYTILHEYGNTKVPNSILIFDWQGNPIKKIKTDKYLSRLCVDENKSKIYVLALNEDNGYELSWLEINN